jgi:hypothetical protein
MMQNSFKFQPISFSWVAIHPQPKGVILFIGGAFFGSFPTLAYRYLLSQLFDAGYTVVALPFRFSFRHWLIVFDLLKEQRELRRILIEMDHHARTSNQESIYARQDHYYWVGHSLGCKYIGLLELLGDINQNFAAVQTNLNNCLQRQNGEAQRLIDKLAALNLSIQDQPSVLIAPDISDTQSAIPKPLDGLARWLDRRGWGVLPTRCETQCLIRKSSFFNLTALLSFEDDTIAGSQKHPQIPESDVQWFIDQLKQRAFTILHQELPGKHLEPVGIKVGPWFVDLNPWDKFIKPLRDRKVESTVLDCLEKLQSRQRV